MDITGLLAAGRLRGVLPFAYQYMVGIVWTAMVASLSLSYAGLIAIAEEANQIAARMQLLRIPDIASALLVIIVAVIGPICVSVIAAPLAHAALNLVLPAQRKLRARFFKVDVPETLTVTIPLSSSGHMPSARAILEVLTNLHPPYGEHIRDRFEILHFRAEVIIPVAVLLGEMVFAAARRSWTGYVSVLLGVALGGAVFLASYWAMSSRLDETYADLAYLMDIALADKGKLDATPASKGK